MTSKFDIDLEDGQAAEKAVCEILVESGYPDSKLNDTELRNSNGKPTQEGLRELRKYDIVSPILTVEVKNDLASKEWNRAFIELFCNGKPSGLNATKADLWVQLYYGKDDYDLDISGVWVISTEVLRHYVHHDRFKEARDVPSCGDSGLSSGFAFFPSWFQDKFTQVARFDSKGKIHHISGEITKIIIESTLAESKHLWVFPETIKMTL